MWYNIYGQLHLLVRSPFLLPLPWVSHGGGYFFYLESDSAHDVNPVIFERVGQTHTDGVGLIETLSLA